MNRHERHRHAVAESPIAVAALGQVGLVNLERAIRAEPFRILEGLTIHQFVIRVGDWRGYLDFETDNLAHMHFLSTALAGFTFQLEPVIDVMDAVAVEVRWIAVRQQDDLACRTKAEEPPPAEQT